MRRDPSAPVFMPAHPRAPWLTWAGLLALLSLAALLGRSAVPLDETRYLSVAWEMWLRGDFLVPFKNGEPYSHKPPLLFWLIHGGWFLFGVNEWWPRLIAPLLALANTWLTWRLALRFWPLDGQVARLAPLVLLSTLLWLVYAQALMFDMLVTTCALLGLYALARAAQTGARRAPWWILFGMAVGLGVLAKGPAILVHLLPVAVLAPWWGRIGQTRHWYAGLLLALALGVGVALAWAIPAALHGGEAYRQAIFWGQTANRMVDSFAHKLPFWWYLATLPLFFFPWLAWPGLLRRLPSTLRAGMDDSGMRFILVWLGGGLLIFSAISGKQPHYILPEAPALALLIAHALSRSDAIGRPLLPAGLLMGLGCALAWLSLNPSGNPLNWTSSLSPWAGAGFVVAGLALLPKRSPESTSHWMAVIMPAGVIWLLWVIFRPLAPAFDMLPLAQHLSRLEARGYAIAHDGKYHGQYHFPGRLAHPVQELFSANEFRDWIAAHPNGAMVLYFPRETDVARLGPVHVQPYRSGQAAIFLVAQAADAWARHATPSENPGPE